MIRQNRAVPILLVFTVAWVLYLAGCFGSDEPSTAQIEVPTTVVTTPTAPPVVTAIPADIAEPEEPFTYTVEEGDNMGTIATRFSVTPDQIIRANPGINPSRLFVGDELRIPEATTDATNVNLDPADREEGVSIFYAVQEGDFFGLIAEEHLVALDSLIDENPDVDPASIVPGQILTIPPIYTGLSPEAIAAFSTPVPVEREPGEILFHTVQAGDTLSALADLYGVTSDAILDASLLDDDNLAIGQELTIPPPPTPTPLER